MMSDGAGEMILRRRYYRFLKRLLGISMFIILTCLLIGWYRVGSNVITQTNFPESWDDNRKSSKSRSKEICPIPHLQHEARDSTQRGSPLCHRLEPIPGSCTIASELFLSKPPADCSHQTPLKICLTQMESQMNYSVMCNPKLCGNSGIQLGVTKKETGSINWQVFQSSKILEKKISELASGKAGVKTYGFVLLKCASVESVTNMTKKMEYDDVWNVDYVEPDREVVQLMSLPEHDALKGRDSNQDAISVNIIWLDSLSRHHFFRSLPGTVAVIEKINSDSKVKATVLDYKLFQSIKARTYENLQALIAGEVDLNAVPFGVHDMPDKPLHLESLLNPLRSTGYGTIWLEDMCWHWEWGLPKDLLSFEKDQPKEVLWKRYLHALEKAGIDGVGPTVASCHILDYYGRNDPFYGPEALCYNGLPQHEYLLGYLQMQQELFRYHSKPLFSMFISSVSHEPTGRRLQTVDKALAEYLLFSAHQPNTVTFFLSDHGNSYGTFLQESAEAQVELYQPFLFIVTPDKILQKLGRSQTEALIANQNGLVSMFDLHMTLKTLMGVDVKTDNTFVGSRAALRYNIPERGLLQPVPLNRTCDSLPLLRPNLCICQGYEQSVSNSSYYSLFAEYALGQLNNEIQRQYREANPSAKSGFGRCQRLMATWFENVRIVYETREKFTVKLDLHIPSPDSNSLETFLVVVASGGTSSHHTSLLSFERISMYGIYRQCADNSVDVKLCICSLSAANSQKTVDAPPRVTSLEEQVLDSDTVVTGIDKDESETCLYILTKQNSAGVSFEAANLCTDRTFTVRFHLTTVNMVSSVTTWPLTVSLGTGDVKFLCTETRAKQNEQWNWKYKIHYNEYY